MTPSKKLAQALYRLGDAERRFLRGAAAQLGLGGTDFEALLLIDALGPLPAGKIAEALSITTGAVSGLVDRLETAGWVERTRHDSDRRQVLVALASERRTAFDGHRAHRERLLGDAVSAVDDATLGASVSLIEAAAERLLAGAEQMTAGDTASDDGERAPIGEIEHGRLRFLSGAPRLELRSGKIRDLYRATFEGRRPQVRVDLGGPNTGTVTCHYKGFSWFGWRDTSAEVTLTTAVPWTIEIRGGVAQLRADLRDLDLRGLQITGGASECEIRLPRPHGEVTLRVTGGANHVVVRRPRGAAAQAVVKGGANSLAFDEQRMGSVGGTARFATPGWDGAADRWSIELAGGASDLSVVEE